MTSTIIMALPKSYLLSDEEMAQIREGLESYDDYFGYYEEQAEKQGKTEVLDEREKIQQMLDSGNFEEVVEEDPVNDDVKNRDIAEAMHLLTTKGHIWCDWENPFDSLPIIIAADAITKTLHEKIIIRPINACASNGGQILNILADEYINQPGMKLAKEFILDED